MSYGSPHPQVLAGSVKDALRNGLIDAVSRNIDPPEPRGVSLVGIPFFHVSALGRYHDLEADEVAHIGNGLAQYHGTLEDAILVTT